MLFGLIPSTPSSPLTPFSQTWLCPVEPIITSTFDTVYSGFSLATEQTPAVTALAGSKFYWTTLLPQAASNHHAVTVPSESPPVFRLGDLLMSPSSDRSFLGSKPVQPKAGDKQTHTSPRLDFTWNEFQLYNIVFHSPKLHFILNANMWLRPAPSTSSKVCLSRARWARLPSGWSHVTKLQGQDWETLELTD